MIKEIFADLDGVIRIWSAEQLHQLEAEYSLDKGTVFTICFEKGLLHQVTLQ